MIALTFFSLVASFVGFAAADLQITQPSANLWWVAQSPNALVWTCDQSTHDNFTILISNSNKAILQAPEAIVAIQQNSACSKLLTPQQSSFTASTGYRIELADPLNVTDVYAQSDEFEIKPFGSPFPTSAT